jgi:hypothetical protein
VLGDVDHEVAAGVSRPDDEDAVALDLASSQLILPETRWGSADPTRRQLLERSQNAGVSLVPVVELESPASALALAARGVGDTVISLPLAQYLGYIGRLHWVPSPLRCMRPSPSSPATTPTSPPRHECSSDWPAGTCSTCRMTVRQLAASATAGNAIGLICGCPAPVEMILSPLA